MKSKKSRNLLLLAILIIFSMQLFGLGVLFVLPAGVARADVGVNPKVLPAGVARAEEDKRIITKIKEALTGENVTFTPQVDIPGSTFTRSNDPIKFNKENRGLLLAQYIRAWYKFAVAAVGILAVVMIMAGGLIWLTAGGRANQISTAKDWITGAVVGLVLALMSYTLLDILNPNLVTFQSLVIEDVGNVSLNSDCSVKDVCVEGEREDPSSCIAIEKEKKCCCPGRGECYSISLALCDSYSNCVKMTTSEGDKCAYKEGSNCYIYSSINGCNNDKNCAWSAVSGYCLEKEVKEGCIGEGTAANGSGCFLNSKCCSGYCNTWGSGLCENPPS
ncbi:MAG: hypothetical protein ABIC82_00045 [bacterium]